MLEDERQIRDLYSKLLQAWNDNNASTFASLFLQDGICVGFDGSEYTAASEMEAGLAAIFKDHQVATYVWKVRNVKMLDNQVALLRGVASMVPPNGSDVMPERNAVQLLVVCKHDGSWRIASYQNTFARYDGRPVVAEALTDELQAVADELRK
jgi:uncharacterized protein (TIGR02246 family)